MKRLAKGQWQGRDDGDQDQGQAPTRESLHGVPFTKMVNVQD